jgi:hypothetical protein
MSRAIVMSLSMTARPFAADVYFNDFNGPPGTTYPEWDVERVHEYGKSGGDGRIGEGNTDGDDSSSLFEGKGLDDESWGIDNVRVTTGERQE